MFIGCMLGVWTGGEDWVCGTHCGTVYASWSHLEHLTLSSLSLPAGTVIAIPSRCLSVYDPALPESRLRPAGGRCSIPSIALLMVS
jgi:ABC-type proline/glycine betaine transport system permease subunit